jgi:hypothetical protein
VRGSITLSPPSPFKGEDKGEGQFGNEENEEEEEKIMKLWGCVDQWIGKRTFPCLKFSPPRILADWKLFGI